jgi:hypothetical protein
MSWPEGVTTEVLRQGFTEQDEDDVEGFKPEKGPEITWESPSTITTLYSITIQCRPEEKAILKNFYRNNRTRQFYRPDPATKEMCRMKFAAPISWIEIAENLWHGSTQLRRMP